MNDCISVSRGLSFIPRDDIVAKSALSRWNTPWASLPTFLREQPSVAAVAMNSQASWPTTVEWCITVGAGHSSLQILSSSSVIYFYDFRHRLLYVAVFGARGSGSRVRVRVESQRR